MSGLFGYHIADQIYIKKGNFRCIIAYSWEAVRNGLVCNGLAYKKEKRIDSLIYPFSKPN
jgi:hypothetical protein